MFSYCFLLKCIFIRRVIKRKSEDLRPLIFMFQYAYTLSCIYPDIKFTARDKKRKGTKRPISRSTKERIILSLANLNLSNSYSVIPL